MPKLSPVAQQQWQRFKAIKRGYWSAVFFVVLLFLSAFAELLINSRALVVSYQGELYFPTYTAYKPGQTFGLDYEWETNYRELAEHFQQSDENWVLMPIAPYDPLENHFKETTYPPYPPNLSDGHYLGTDTSGRDILARLVYGFRLAIWFSLLLLICNYLIGVGLGSLMGFWGGAFDMFFQRLIEIWSNIPFLYVIMIIASIIIPDFWALLIIMIIFGWMGMTWYMRTATYKEAARDYVLAAKALGASNTRIILRHILPNTVSVLVTFVPFSIAAGITSLTALDYLGFGLPPPTPSWGELLRQGTDNLNHPWIVGSVIVAMTVILLMVTYIGEAIREAFDPKKFTTYE